MTQGDHRKGPGRAHPGRSIRAGEPGTSITGNVDHVVINLPGLQPPPRRRRPILAASAVAGTTAAVAVAVVLAGRGAPAGSGPMSPGQSTIATGLHANGDYGIFAIDRQGHIIHSVTSPAGDEGPWTMFGLEGTAAAITTASDSGQLLHVMAVMADGSVQQRWEETPGQWGHWQLFAPAGTAVQASIGQSGGGLTVYALTPGGTISNTSQEAAYTPQVPTGHLWSAWVPDVQPCCTAASVDVGFDYPRGLTVLAVDTDGTLRSLSQGQPGGPGAGGWKTLGPAGGFGPGSPPPGA